MNHEFTVPFKTELLLNTTDCKVLSLAAGGESLGFIAINHVVTEAGMQAHFTPFTSEGVLKEHCCLSCSAKALFKEKTGFSLKSISIAETENTRPSLAGLLPLILMASMANEDKPS